MKIYSILLTVLLTGCSSLGFLTPRQFDSVEYSTAVEITQFATKTIHQCSSPDKQLFKTFLDELNTTSMFFLEYANNKKDENDIQTGAKQIRTMVLEFDSRAKYSLNYCVGKLSNIQNAARTVGRAISRLDTIDTCKAKLDVLWIPLKEQQAKKSISDGEFRELSTDITRLARINLAACSSQEREEIEKSISVIKAAVSLIPL